MDEREKQQIRKVHGKYGIGRYEHRTGRLIDRYGNYIDDWGNLLDKDRNIIGFTKDSNY